MLEGLVGYIRCRFIAVFPAGPALSSHSRGGVHRRLS